METEFDICFSFFLNEFLRNRKYWIFIEFGDFLESLKNRRLQVHLNGKTLENFKHSSNEQSRFLTFFIGKKLDFSEFFEKLTFKTYVLGKFITRNWF